MSVDSRIALFLLMEFAVLVMLPERFFDLLPLLVSSALMLILHGGVPLRSWWTRAWRLKWFYLSIAAFYLIHEPTLGWGWYPEYLPLVGLYVLKLMALMMVVSWFFAQGDRGSWIQAIMFWGVPLNSLGLPVERFSVRLMLALSYADAWLQGPRASSVANPDWRQRCNQLQEQLQERLLALPDNASAPQVALEELSPVSAIQWILLFGWSSLLLLSLIWRPW